MWNIGVSISPQPILYIPCFRGYRGIWESLYPLTGTGKNIVTRGDRSIPKQDKTSAGQDAVIGTYRSRSVGEQHTSFPTRVLEINA